MKFDSETHEYGTRRSRSMDWQDVVACISSMIQTENHYLCHDYLNLKWSQRELMPSGMCMDNIECVDETCRALVCNWMYNVIDATKLRRETASVAMSYLDRFVCSQSPRAMMTRSSRKQYQLAAMTCLYIAVKIHEPVQITANFICKISRGMHSAEEVTSLEYDILVALQWRLHGPTSNQFVNYFLELLPESSTPAAALALLYKYSHRQAEASIKNYDFVPLRNSTIAIASILNGLEFVPLEDFPLCARLRFFEFISIAFDFDGCSILIPVTRELLRGSCNTQGAAGSVPREEAECNETPFATAA